MIGTEKGRGNGATNGSDKAGLERDEAGLKRGEERAVLQRDEGAGLEGRESGT